MSSLKTALRLLGTNPRGFLKTIFDKLNKRVDECKGYLSLLFGEQSYLDDERDTLGNFDYEKLLNLLHEVESNDC